MLVLVPSSLAVELTGHLLEGYGRASDEGPVEAGLVGQKERHNEEDGKEDDRCSDPYPIPGRSCRSACCGVMAANWVLLSCARGARFSKSSPSHIMANTKKSANASTQQAIRKPSTRPTWQATTPILRRSESKTLRSSNTAAVSQKKVKKSVGIMTSTASVPITP